MSFKKFLKTFILVISTGCVANAYLVPGDQHRGGGANPGRPPQYQPPGRPQPRPQPPRPRPQPPRPPMPPPHHPQPPRPPMPPPHRPQPPRPPMPPPHYPQPPRPQPPYYPPQPPPHQGYWDTATETIYVGRAVNNERFFLREMSRLDGTYRGWEVVAVRANTSPNSPYNTTVQLIADNRVIAQQVNPGRLINLMPSGAVLDQNVSSLQLSIIGSTVIVDSIVIELRVYRY